MKTHLGRMEAFDALLEARFEDSFSEPEAGSEHLDDEAERSTGERVGDGERDSLPAMPPPAAGRTPRSQAAPFA